MMGTAYQLAQRLAAKRQPNGQWVARCPAHDDKHASLSIGESENGKLLLNCFAGCSFDKIAAALELPRSSPSSGTSKSTIEKIYPYTDESGKQRYEVVRYRYADGSKSFKQRQSEDNWSMQGVEPLLYRLPDVLESIAAGKPIIYVEGEKDADTLASLGFSATTNHGGAKNKTAIEKTAHYLVGANVIIMPDNDAPGSEHRDLVAAALQATGVQYKIAIVPQPYKDITDYVRDAASPSRDVQTLIDQADSPPERKSRFKLLHASDLATLPPLTYLIDGEIPSNGLTVLYGASGVGKSFVALDYALRIAQSHDVVYVAGEGQLGYADRVAAWCNHHKTSAGNLFFITEAVRMLASGDVQAFIAEIMPLEPKLIVLDTLARTMIGGDENSARDMGVYIDACNRVQRETGAAVLVVHHTGKSGASERGSSALRGAADSMIELSNNDEVLALSCAKSKDAEPFATATCD